MKIHCLIPSFFSLDQWQHLPSSPFLLRFFCSKMNCHLISSSCKSFEWVDKTPGQIGRTGSFVRSWWFVPAGHFLSCQRFCVAGEARGICRDLGALCILHCDSPTELQKEIPNLLCGYPRAAWRLLLPPLPWSKAFEAEAMGIAVCIPNFWVSTPVLWSLHPAGSLWIWAQAPLWLALLLGMGSCNVHHLCSVSASP